MSTDTSAGSNALNSGAGADIPRDRSRLIDDRRVQHEVQASAAPASRTPPQLVYPPVTEERPSSRPVFIAAFAALVLLVAVGVLLVRQGHSATADPVVSQLSSTQGAAVDSQVSFGPGLVLSESEHVVFDKPVSSVTLAVPRLAASAGGGAFDPRIGNLQILVGDGPPMNVRQSLHAGSSVTVTLPTASSRLDVVFVAYHSVVRSQPSSRHRAIALVTPLTLTPTSGLTSTLHVAGDNVTNIGCTSPDGTSQSCGSESSDGWTVTRTPQHQDDAVIAQLDLQP